jgi:hypothetical protein
VKIYISFTVPVSKEEGLVPRTLTAKDFKKVQNQIGFCGIWCGSCVVGNGALREMTMRYEDVVKSYGLEGWAPNDFSFKEFVKGLSSIQNMPLCPGCLKGGGRDNCEMKACAMSRKVSECIECDQTTACKNHETLKNMRTGAQDAGIFVKTEKVNRKELVKKWTTELKSKCPHQILF